MPPTHGADPDGHPQKGPEPQELGQHFFQQG